MRRLVLSLIGLLVPATLALAHSGHGTTDPASVIHHVAEPVHILPAIIVGALLAGIAVVLQWIKRSR
ncbi:MAG: hypothetical protein KDA90_16880 [Planctomycetaceae bacterium]|nr:hypothetical protein [Planctomycetaceae bacterium]